MRRNVAGYGVLLVSLLANVYLFATRRSESHAHTPTVRPRPADPPASWHELNVPELRDPATKYAGLDRDALARRLAGVEGRIEKLRTPEQKFDSGKPTPETEAVVRPYMDRVFEVKPGTPLPYKLECRGGACKIISDAPMSGWMEKMQSLYPDRVRFRMMFHFNDAYIEPGHPEQTSGAWLWWAIVGTARPAIVNCVKTIEAKGDLSIVLELDPSTRRVTPDASGSLAEDPIAACLRKALDDAIAKTPVPPEAKAIHGQPLDFTFPIERKSE